MGPLQLVSNHPGQEPTPAKRPVLRVIEGGGIDPEAERRVWRYTPTGRLLPLTHRWDRISLSCWRATREWRSLSAALDHATDAIAEAREHELDSALDAWRSVATAIIACKAAPRDGYHPLRIKIGLAAIVSGTPFTFGGISDNPQTTTAWAFAAIDWVVFCDSWRAREEASKPSRKRATKTVAPDVEAAARL
jgi:hypothetical protein